MPFLLREFHMPVFGTTFTLELLKEKLREHQLEETADLRSVSAGESLRLDPFEIEFIRVDHSIVDGVGLAHTNARRHSDPFRRFQGGSHAHGRRRDRPSPVRTLRK